MLLPLHHLFSGLVQIRFTFSLMISSPVGYLTAAQSKTAMNAYVPDGMSKEEYAKLKKKEAYKGQNLGASGPRGYKSRSFNDFVS